MGWELIATDLNGNVHGEITNATNRKVSLPHMGVPTASCSIPLSHPLANTLLDTDCLIKAYRSDPVYGTRSLVFHGPVVTAEESADENGQTVAINASGPFWRLTKRVLTTSKSGIKFGPKALSQIAHEMLSTANGYSFTGISEGTRDSTGVISGELGPIWLDKTVASAISELHVGLDSFEYVIEPTEPTEVGGVGGWPQIGEMNIEAFVGENRPDAIFEYGTTKANVKSYKRSVSRENLLTRAVISVEGWPDNPVEDRGLITRTQNTATRGVFEEEVPHNSVSNDGFRQQIADFHLKYRKDPRQIITFTPVKNARPSPITDYTVGDIVRARAMVNGVVRFDYEFRVWGISFDIDVNGNETVELQLVDEGN